MRFPIPRALKAAMPEAAVSRLRRTRSRFLGWRARRSTPETYWTRHHVDSPDGGFASPEQSLAHYRWRVMQNPGHYELMPVSGADGLVVVDYGCGPGNDIIGFCSQSRPKRMLACDVSKTALAKTEARAKLHGFNVELIQLQERSPQVPVPEASVDLIHSSGVIHHASDPVAILREMRRLLRPSARAQVMVYNRDSIWMHLYVAYERMLVRGLSAGLTKEQAFHQATDGEACPIAACYRPAEFIALANTAGLACEHVGNGISWLELGLMQRRCDAMQDKRLDEESRAFLYDLTFDARGWPLKHGQVAGVYSCFQLRVAS